MHVKSQTIKRNSKIKVVKHYVHTKGVMHTVLSLKLVIAYNNALDKLSSRWQVVYIYTTRNFRVFDSWTITKRERENVTSVG